MKQIQRGLTLIELMIIIAILGILVAVMLPAYSEYAVRGKVSELLVISSGFKATIGEKAQSDSTLASAGLGLTIIPGGRISVGSITLGGVIALSGSTATLGAPVSVVLSPSIMPGGRISWTCSTNNDSTQWKYVPAQCRNL